MHRYTSRELLAVCLIGVSMIAGLAVMGLSASIIAKDHDSKIAIVHLCVV